MTSDQPLPPSQQTQPAQPDTHAALTSYRIDDPLFQVCILSGFEAAPASDALSLMLVGGGAVQYYAWSPNLRRPTNDVDLQHKAYAPKSVRHAWGTFAQQSLERYGYTGAYKHTKTGGELRICGSKPLFFLHLDLYTPRFSKRYAKRIAAEFERSETLVLPGKTDGIEYRVEEPEDVLGYKISRLIGAATQGVLSPEDARTVALLKDGLVDDVVVDDLETRLQRVLEKRMLSLELVDRIGEETLQRAIMSYRDAKNIYDVLLLVESSRKLGRPLDKTIICQHFDL